MQSLMIPGLATPASCLALGTAAFGSIVPEGLAFNLLDTFADAGGTVIDTAHVYADWLGGEKSLSEKTIGAWLRRRGGGQGLIIVTKGAHPDLATPLVPRLSPAEIVADLDASLKRLGVERIDLYFLHRDDPARPVAEIMEVLDAQVRAGKVAAIGCSNWQIPRITAAQAHATAHGLTPFAASEAFFSLATANPDTFAADHALIDDAALTYHRTSGLPLLAYTSQARGYFAKAAEIGPDALSPALRTAFDNPVNRARLDRARTVAAARQVRVSSVALAAVTSLPGIAIIGPLTKAHLDDALLAADLRLTDEEQAFLFAATVGGL